MKLENINADTLGQLTVRQETIRVRGVEKEFLLLSLGANLTVDSSACTLNRLYIEITAHDEHDPDFVLSTYDYDISMVKGVLSLQYMEGSRLPTSSKLLFTGLYYDVMEGVLEAEPKINSKKPLNWKQIEVLCRGVLPVIGGGRSYNMLVKIHRDIDLALPPYSPTDVSLVQFISM